MNKPIFLVDASMIEQPAIQSISRDAMTMLAGSRDPYLKVTIDATHSGLVTNRRVYPALRVMEGYTSFTSKANGGSADYDKPVLLHHDEFQDPVGRIRSATFTPLKQGADLHNDFQNPDREGKGSGVVTVSAHITDPEAIKKILDGRYLTVSAGHSTDCWTCSICGNDMLKDDDCEHSPGRTYEVDGQNYECYAITNNMTYHEVSFVNTPAQEAAQITEKSMQTDWKEYRNQFRDSKDVTTYVTFTKRPKDIVHELVLADAKGDLSLNLLTGKEKKKDGKKATFVCMAPPAKAALQANSSKDGDIETPAPAAKGNVDQSRPEKQPNVDSTGTKSPTPAVPANGHQDDSSTKPEDRKSPGLEATSNQESPKMEPEKITLTTEEVKAMLDALRAENDSLKKDKSELSKKVETLETAKQGKDAEVTRLTGDLAKQQSEMQRILATSLAHGRIQLKKPDTTGLDSKEKLDQFIEKLSQRSIDSLKDSLSDIGLEREVPKAETKPASQVADSAAAPQVTSPAAVKPQVETHKSTDAAPKKLPASASLEKELKL